MTERELSNLYYIRKRITRLKNRIAELEQETGVSGQALTGMPHGTGVSNPVESLVIKEWELWNKLKKAEAEEVEEELKITDYISGVENEEIKLIMESRFIDNKTWEKIGEELYCDPRTVARKMRKYLKTH